MNGGICERIFDKAKQCLDERDDPDNPTIVLSAQDVLTGRQAAMLTSVPAESGRMSDHFLFGSTKHCPLLSAA